MGLQTYPPAAIHIVEKKQARNYAPDLLFYLARPEGVEPPTYRSVVCRSIQLSYGRTYSLFYHSEWLLFFERINLTL